MGGPVIRVCTAVRPAHGREAGVHGPMTPAGAGWPDSGRPTGWPGRSLWTRVIDIGRTRATPGIPDKARISRSVARADTEEASAISSREPAVWNR